MIEGSEGELAPDCLEFGKEIVVDVTGIIISRRSLGKNLAFAHIKLIGPPADCGVSDKDVTTIQVVFRRRSSWWEKGFDSTFPTKNSHLPYGARVKLLIGKDGDDADESQERGDQKYEVHRWWIIFDPRKQAENVARQRTSTEQESGTPGEGILCSKYFASRMDHFLKHGSQHRTDKHDLPKKVDTKKEARALRILEGPSPHGNKKHKAMRAKIFASFLIEKFGRDFFGRQQRSCSDAEGFEVDANGVLDIAGGKGHLSFELSLQSQTQCTIIDPLIRGKGEKTEHGQQFQKRQVKRLNKLDAPEPKHMPMRFTLDSEECMHLLRRSRLVVGLHPDECTEDILDAAILWNKPCAIIPCCVFADLRPGRRLKGDGDNGRRVRTYDEFMQYLLEKDERIDRFTLNFEGKNEVLIFDPR